MNLTTRYAMVLLGVLVFYQVVVSNPSFIGVYILLMGLGIVMYVDSYFSLRFVEFKRLQRNKKEDFTRISDRLMERQDHEWETNPRISNRIRERGIIHGLIRARFREFVFMCVAVFIVTTLWGPDSDIMGLLTVIIAFYAGYIFRQSTGIQDVLADYKELFDDD